MQVRAGDVAGRTDRLMTWPAFTEWPVLTPIAVVRVARLTTAPVGVTVRITVELPWAFPPGRHNTPGGRGVNRRRTDRSLGRCGAQDHMGPACPKLADKGASATATPLPARDTTGGRLLANSAAVTDRLHVRRVRL